MIEEGVGLMLVGMGVVFLFLSVMVMLMHVSTAFFRRFGYLFAEAPVPQSVVTVSAPQACEIVAGGEEVAVAIAAVLRQRARHGATGGQHG